MTRLFPTGHWSRQAWPVIASLYAAFLLALVLPCERPPKAMNRGWPIGLSFLKDGRKVQVWRLGEIRVGAATESIRAPAWGEVPGFMSAMALVTEATFATANEAGRVTLRPLAATGLSATWMAHTRPVSSLVAGPKGRRLFTSSHDLAVRSWDISHVGTTPPSGQEITRHSDWVYALALSSDGHWLASGDRSGGLQLIDLETGRKRSLPTRSSAVYSLAWLGTEHLLVSEASGDLWTWSIDEESFERPFQRLGNGAWTQLTTIGSSRVAGSNSAGQVWFFERREKQTHGARLGTISGAATALAFHPLRGQVVATGPLQPIARSFSLPGRSATDT